MLCSLEIQLDMVEEKVIKTQKIKPTLNRSWKSQFPTGQQLQVLLGPTVL